MGDSWNEHASIDVPSLCIGVRVMNIINEACKEVGTNYAVIPGNHDAYSSDYSALEALRGIDVVWKPTVYDKTVGAFPFTKNAEVATGWIRELEAKSDVILAHIDVIGAGPHFKSVEGVDPNAFSGPIYCGHYHHPHEIGCFKFIGSVMHHNFGDEEVEGAPRGAVMLTIKGGKVVKEKRYPNPHTSIYHKTDWSKRSQREKTMRMYGLYEDRLHLRVKCKATEVKDVKEDVLERFPKLLSYNIVGVSEDSEAVDREVAVRVDASPEEAVKAYMKNTGVPEGLDEERLLELGSALVLPSV